MSEKGIALVTNALENAGPPAVEVLAAQGYVTLCHSSAFSETAERTRFESSGPGRIASSAATPADLASEAIERFGRVDVAVSNEFAEVFQGPFDTWSADDYRKALETFTVAPYCLAAGVVPQMKQQRSGRIVFMTSASALKPSPNLVLYSAARAATNEMVRSLAAEIGPWGISVNAIAPALLLTRFFPLGEKDPKLAELVDKMIPMKRFGRPEEVGALIELLTSGKADYISGQIIGFSGAEV